MEVTEASSALPRLTSPPPSQLLNVSMSHQLVIDLCRNAIVTALSIAAPMLLIALAIGLLVSVIQSVTQIQEQTLTFVPKLVFVGAAFIVGLPWLLQVLAKYTTDLFQSIPSAVS